MLSDHLKDSASANSPEVLEARAVFNQGYSVTRQIAELREKRHVTRIDLAEKAGLPRAQTDRMEWGVIGPTSTTLAKIPDSLMADVRPGRARACPDAEPVRGRVS